MNGPDTGRRTRGRRDPGLRQLLAVISMASVLLLAWYLVPRIEHRAVNTFIGEQFDPPTAGPELAGTWAAGYPPRGVEAQKQPLGKPAPLARTSDSYSFITDGSKTTFTAYDPCRPIHFVVRPDNAPAGGRALITRAVAAASKASGLVFIDDGNTSEAYSKDRAVYQPQRYGQRWAPVLFVWETHAEQPQFLKHPVPGVESMAGIGGSQAIAGDEGSRVFVTGGVELNATLLAMMMKDPNGPATAGAVVEHEVGHLLGLGHVPDPTQLMDPQGSTAVTGYAAGDLTGLARLGRGKCYPNH